MNKDYLVVSVCYLPNDNTIFSYKHVFDGWANKFVTVGLFTLFCNAEVNTMTYFLIMC